MNGGLISQWNKKVRKNDEVVILGDFSIDKGEKTNELLCRLNGRKYLIMGNHDRFLDDKAFDRSLFKWIELDKKRRATIPVLGEYQDDWMVDLKNS